MSINVQYLITVNKNMPIVDVVGKVLVDRVSKEETNRKLLQSASEVIDKVKLNNGTLLENPSRPNCKEKCVYFSVGFRSFEDMAMFLNSMHYLE